MKRIITGILTLTLFTTSILAQMGKDDDSRFGHGEDSVRCIRNLSLYRENVKGSTRDYDMAYGPWKTVFGECPQASKNIYLDGVKIYKYFLGQKPEEPRKTELCDTLMLIYDMRVEHYGEEGKVRGRQGADLLKYRRNDDIKFVQQGYNYLKKSVELQQIKTSKAVLPTLLSASITLYKAEVFEASTVIEDYLLVSSIVDQQIAAKPTDKKLEKLKVTLDKNFVEEGPGDCETLVSFFTEEHKTKKEDAEFLTMLTKLLSARECTNSDLFLIASKDLHSLSPTATSAINIAKLAENKSDYAGAIEYYTQALELETDLSKQGDLQYNLAVVYSKAKEYSKSRQAALKSAELKPDFGEPYILIGRLYVQSLSLCTNSDSKNIPEAVYWVAVDKFVKAKSVDPSLEQRANELISTYSKHYPDKEAAFFKGVKEGESYHVKGCWINESTRVRF